jgi:hypothetical protein
VQPEYRSATSRNMAKDRFVTGESGSPCYAAAASLMALSMDFVAKPAEARRAQTAIPEAVTNTMKGVSGYAGCLVMVADQEARLITLITFWIGEQRTQSCQQNERWLRKLLAPYLEGCLRTRTFAAHRAEMLEMRGNGEMEEIHSGSTSYGSARNALAAA